MTCITRKALRSLAAWSILAGLAGCAVIDHGADRNVILGLEQEWLDCHNAAVLTRILADDFRHPVSSGKFLTKQQDIAWLVGHPNREGVRSSYKNMTVDFYGDVSVVRTIIQESDWKGGIVNMRIATDIFVKRNGQWQAISTQDNVIPRR